MRLMVMETHPQAGGGCEMVALQVAVGMRQRGHEVHLAFDRAGTLLPRYQEAGVLVHTVPVRPVSLRHWPACYRVFRAAVRFVKQIRPDVIFSGHLGLIRLAAVLRQCTGVRSVFHLGLPGGATGGFDRWCRSQIAEGVAPSQHTAAIWTSHGWDRLTVVPNWVDTSRFKPAEDRTTLRRVLHLPDKPIVLFLGRIVEEKGVEFLLRAFARMPEGDSVLVLVGLLSPEYAAHLRELSSALRIDPERLRIVAPTAEPELWYAAADLVVVPSLWQEPFGLTLIEAMSSGTPVVATRVGMFPEILGAGNGDLLVAADDDAALASLMDRWLRAPDQRLAKGASLRQSALASFGGDSSLRCYEAILLNAAAPASRVC